MNKANISIYYLVLLSPLSPFRWLQNMILSDMLAILR